MLHCKNVSNCQTIAVSATDTDVFLLLLHHAYGMDIKIWMMTGTVITTLPSGACRMCSVAKKNAKSSLFSGKERKLGKLEGRGTLRFSITLLIGCTDFDFFLRSGNKSLLLDILLKNVDINGVIDFNDRSALIIDGKFLVQSLKHQGLRTFGALKAVTILCNVFLSALTIFPFSW
jgi:hypothetical protein